MSHDSGYAPFLDEILQDENTRKRVTILEGFPTARELKATGVNVYSGLSDTLFRADKIAPFIPNSYANGHNNGNMNHEANLSPSPPRSESPSALPVLSKTSSWATATRAVTPPPKITTPLAHRLPAPVKVKEQPVKWSPGPRGLDPPVSATPEALKSIKERDKGKKFCNNFYLRGSCALKGSGCQFIHNAKPKPEELAAMKLLTRMNPCSAGQDCYVEDCIYGHHVSVSSLMAPNGELT